MSKITLPYTLTAGTVAKATEVMADLNALLALVNGGFGSDNFPAGTLQAGWVPATGELTGLVEGEYKTVPGCEKVVTVAGNATILVVGAAALEDGGNSLTSRINFVGTGSVGDGEMAHDTDFSLFFDLVNPIAGRNVSAGSTAIRLEAKRISVASKPGARVRHAGTGFIYLVVPR